MIGSINTWQIILAVELVTSILTFFLTVYIIFASYKYLKANGLFFLHVLFLYPSFWQVLASALGLVLYTQQWLDVWFILNIFFEILGTASTVVYLNRILKQYYRLLGETYSPVNLLILILLLAGSILCLVGLIQIRTTFIYFQAGSSVIAGGCVILFLMSCMNLVRSGNKKFFTLFTLSAAFMVANSGYFLYLAFNNIMLFQWADYILFIVLDFIAKFICLALSQFLVPGIAVGGGDDEK